MACVEAHFGQKVLVIADTGDLHKAIRTILCPDRSASALDGLEPAPLGSATQLARESLCDFHVDSAYRGIEALAKVKQALAESAPCALAFVEAGMSSGWDGIETVHHLWAVQPDLPIVICTACSGRSVEDMVARLGHLDRFVIVKPPLDNIEVLQLTHVLTRKWQLAQRAQLLMSELDTMVAQQTAKLSASNALLHAEIRRREQTEIGIARL